MKHKNVKRLRAAMAGTLASALLTAVASASQAAPGSTALPAGPSPSALAWQSRALESTTRISELARSDSAVAGVAIDPSTQTVIIYRKGTAPTGLYGSVAVPAGTRVEFRPAPMTAGETTRVADAVWQGRVALARQGIVVTGVSTRWDGHVTVHVQRITPATDAAIQRFALFGPGTVRVQQGSFIRPLHRFNDTARFIAGDRIHSATGTFAGGGTGHLNCSSGFTGLGLGNGKHYLITAFHCAKPSDPRFWAEGDTTNAYIGKASVLDKGHDLAYIPTSTLPYTWDGLLFPFSAEFTKPVTGGTGGKGAVKPAPGAQICTSGASIGVRCYGTIGNTYLHTQQCGEWAGQGCWDVVVWTATSNSGGPITADGNSGGPVFTPHSSQVTAVGTVIGTFSGYQVSCDSQTDPGTSECDSLVAFSDIYTEAVLNHNLDLTR